MPRILKGSDEAKQRMQHLRSLRKSKSSKHIEEKSNASSSSNESPKETVEEPIVGTGKKSNSWIKHVQAFAKANNINYFEALKHSKVKDGYKK